MTSEDPGACPALLCKIRPAAVAACNAYRVRARVVSRAACPRVWRGSAWCTEHRCGLHGRDAADVCAHCHSHQPASAAERRRHHRSGLAHSQRGVRHARRRRLAAGQPHRGVCFPRLVDGGQLAHWLPAVVRSPQAAAARHCCRAAGAWSQGSLSNCKSRATSSRRLSWAVSWGWGRWQPSWSQPWPGAAAALCEQHLARLCGRALPGRQAAAPVGQRRARGRLKAAPLAPVLEAMYPGARVHHGFLRSFQAVTSAAGNASTDLGRAPARAADGNAHPL